MNTDHNADVNSQEHAPGELQDHSEMPAPEQSEAQTEHIEQMEQAAGEALDQAEGDAEVEAQQMQATADSDSGQTILGSIGDGLKEAGDAVVHATERLLGKDLDGDGQIG